MEELEKIYIVAKIINLKNKYVSAYEIIEASEQKISKDDLERILPSLIQVGSIEREHGSIEGEVDVWLPNYRMTSFGKLRIERISKATTGNPASLQDDKKTKGETTKENQDTPEKTSGEKRFEELQKYNLPSFLKQKQIEEPQIKAAIEKNNLPYIIALLNEIGYLDYFKKEYCNGESKKRDTLLSTILETNSRMIKGNINVLNPKSKEDKTHYTSHTHKQNVNKLIKGQ